MLLDRAELGGGLGPDDAEQLVRRVGVEVPRCGRLRLALPVADLDLCGGVLGELGAQTERVVLGEVAVPLSLEALVLREVVQLPVEDRLVVFGWQLALLVGHETLRAANVAGLTR